MSSIVLRSTLNKADPKSLFFHEGDLKVLIDNENKYMGCSFRLDRLITFDELKGLLDEVYFPLLATGQINEEPRGKIYRTALRSVYNIVDPSKYNSECYVSDRISKELIYDSSIAAYYCYQSYRVPMLPVMANVKHKARYNNWL